MRAGNLAIAVGLVVAGTLALGQASVCFGIPQKVKPAQPPARLLSDRIASEPFVIVESGVPTYVVPEEPPLWVVANWVTPYPDSTACPGDPFGAHGGEATGGPPGAATWCLEDSVADSCGTVPPWDAACFTYQDVRTLPSQMGINYWHIDHFRAFDQRPYTGTRVLWCGSDSLWITMPYEETPVECGAWVNPPGYGNEWNCVVQLSLPEDFDVSYGCTLYFDPRYDTECKYDFLYVDYDSMGPAPTCRQTWATLATFNATSNNPGGPCGPDANPNPDYWGNTDLDRLLQCNWQERTDPQRPAFAAAITPAMLGSLVRAPKFRWRFVSDGAWSDADGLGDTDGGAWIDNIEVWGDWEWDPRQQHFYRQDFETCSVFGPLPPYWTLEDPPGVCQAWHIIRDSDPPYEGDEGEWWRTAVELDTSWVWRARPDKGYASGTRWRNGWYYRLRSPKIEIPAVGGSGCLVQYDQYTCTQGYSCDYTDTRVRFHNGELHTWCPWINIDGYVLSGGCTFWNIDYTEDISGLYGPTADSLQFAWEIMDVSRRGQHCHGIHGGTNNLIDNVSIGFLSENATVFAARGIDLLHDSFLPGVTQAYNSFFDAYDPNNVALYSGPDAPPLPHDQQLCVDCTDKDGFWGLFIEATIDGGAHWVGKPMTLAVPLDPRHPDLHLGGEYFGTVRADDFSPGTTAWEPGTECWYYVLAIDAFGDSSYFPARADSLHPEHDGTSDDYLIFSILPTYPAGYTYAKILLVDGYGRDVYDWSPCLAVTDEMVALEDLYEQTLADAGYSFDRFDIQGAGGRVHIHPIWLYDCYDAVVWFTGPRFSQGLIDKEAQYALRDYLEDGGHLVLCGDRIAYNMAAVQEDFLLGPLGAEFLSGMMGCTYQDEMEGGFAKPFIRVKAAPSVNVFGSPVAIPLDSMVIYRGDPYPRDMSYVVTNTAPPPNYTAQMLLDVLNPGIDYPNSDAAVYIEHQGGQCVCIDFDLSAIVNRSGGFCSGVTPDPAPDFLAGYYDGRAELLRVILEDLFGLPCNASVPPQEEARYQWALSPNSPNPLSAATEIRFEVANGGMVSIKVYNALGQLVRVLKNEHLAPGRYAVTWDGMNQTRERVSSGVYFCKMDTGRYSATRKMLVVR